MDPVRRANRHAARSFRIPNDSDARRELRFLAERGAVAGISWIAREGQTCRCLRKHGAVNVRCKRRGVKVTDISMLGLVGKVGLTSASHS